MKPFILVLFILIICSCKLVTKIDPQLPYELEVVDTQMAEIKNEPYLDIEVSKKDTLEFLKFWNEFYKSYKNNDSQSIIRMSLDSVESPVFIEKENRFQEDSKHNSINDFLKAGIWNNPPVAPTPFSRHEKSFITYVYQYNPDLLNEKNKQDSIILKYSVLVSSKEIVGNYEFQKFFILSFIKKAKAIKFSGMNIYGESYPKLVNDLTTRSKLYFPLYRKTQDSITNLHAIDTFINLWYSDALSEFKEPNLYKYSGKDDFYRFSWFRSFHHPVVIRFQKSSNDYILTTKEMIDNSGYIPNEFVVNTSRSLPLLTWNDFEIKLGRMGFGNMATLDPEPRPMDGAEWILESKVNGKYHFVTRYSNDPYFRECCKYLLKLSKLKIREKDIY